MARVKGILMVTFVLLLMLFSGCVPKELEDRLSSVERQLRELNRQISSLERRIADIERNVKDFESVRKGYENLKEEVAYLDQNLSKVRETLSADISELVGKYNSLVLNVSSLERMTSITSELEEMKNRVKELEKKVEILSLYPPTGDGKNTTGLSNDLRYILVDMENRIFNLERRSTRIEDLEKRMVDAEKLLSTLSLRVLTSWGGTTLQETSPISAELERKTANLEEKIKSLEGRLEKVEREQSALRSSVNVQQATSTQTPVPTTLNVPDPQLYVEQLRKYLEEFRRLVRSYETSRILGVEEGYVFIRIERGDTLASISEAFGLGPNGVDQIAKLNGITDPRRLVTGQIIKVPVSNLSPVFPIGGKPDPNLVVSSFGFKSDGTFSSGVNLRGSGKKILVALPGRVKRVDKNTVVVYHGNSVETVYKNLTIVAVKEGQWLKAGDTIGYGGENVGFELYVEGEPKDPMLLFFSNMGLFEITFYTEWEDGKLPEHPSFRLTKSGKIPEEWKTAAADTTIFPLGSIIYIPELKESPYGGVFVVEDIGGVIKGRKIDVYLGSIREALYNRKIVSRVFVWRD